MPDMILQHVDTLLVERIHALARDRQWSINDVLLHALRNGLGISAAQEFSESMREPQTLTQLEAKYGLSITIVADDHLAGTHYAIEKGEPRPGSAPIEATSHVKVDSAQIEDLEADESAEEEDEEPAENGVAVAGSWVRPCGMPLALIEV